MKKLIPLLFPIISSAQSVYVECPVTPAGASPSPVEAVNRLDPYMPTEVVDMGGLGPGEIAIRVTLPPGYPAYSLRLANFDESDTAEFETFSNDDGWFIIENLSIQDAYYVDVLFYESAHSNNEFFFRSGFDFLVCSRSTTFVE